LIESNKKNKIIFKELNSSDDYITQNILNTINKQLIEVYLNEIKPSSKVFSFFQNKNFKYINKIIFNKVLVIEYMKGFYYFYNIKHNYGEFFKGYKIVNILYDWSRKLLHSVDLIIITENKENELSLFRYNFNNFITKFELMDHYTKLKNIKNNPFFVKENDNNNFNFSYTSFDELTNNLFVLIFKTKIFLFEKFPLYSILIQTIDISFTLDPIIIKNNELVIISSECFFYRLNLSTSNKDNYTIFRDITLNFNNEKYVELLENLKIIIYFNLELQKIEFKELKFYTKHIFEEYDIFSYVENLVDVLNEEKIMFFLSHNLQSSKLYVILLFCLVFEKINVLKKIFQFLKIYSDNNNDFHYSAYVILFIEFIKDFFSSIDSIKQNNYNIFDVYLMQILPENDYSLYRNMLLK
jgi:hypothetical protein